jgi:RHS repeat-associated protein
MSQSGRAAVGHPVDVATGTLFNTWTDFHLPGGVPILLGRYYSTALLGAQASFLPFGPGWRLNIQHALRQTLEGFAYTDPQNSEFALEDLREDFGRTGRLIVPALGMELRRISEDTLALIRYEAAPAPFQLIFRRADALHYELASIQVNARHRVDISYDAQSRPTRLRQSRGGREVRLTYNKAGQLETLRRPGSGEPWVLRYEYDVHQRLVAVHDRLGVQARFEYDGSGRMRGELKRTGSTYTFEYDAEGRCVRARGVDGYEERWLRYDPPRRQTRVTDSHGYETLYEYNASGQVTQLVSPLGGKWAYAFDEAGRPAAMVDPDKHRTTYTYDALGHLKAVALPNGQRVELRHDTEHRPVEMIDWRGESWQYVYDEAGRLSMTIEPSGTGWRYAHDEYDDVVSVTNPLGATWRITRDVHGQIISQNDWAGSQWAAEYDGSGRLVSSTDPLGGQTIHTYDALGRLQRVRCADGREWSFAYDEAGRLSSFHAPDGTKNSLRYNACGRIIEATDAEGGQVRFTWDTEPNRLLEVLNERGQAYRVEYDPEGRVTQQQFWDGRTVRYEFSPFGLCLARIEPEQQRTEFEYDALGRVICVRAPDGEETCLEYDDNNFLKAVKTADSTLQVERDGIGQILAEVQGGTRVESHYDVLGRRVRLQTSEGLASAFEWNANGGCTAVRRDGGDITFQRDPLGRELMRGLPGGASLTTQYDPLGRVLEQRYQPPGWVALGRDHPTGLEDAAAFSRRYTYDVLGLLSEVQDSIRGRTRYLHDKNSMLVGVVRDHGDAELLGYDKAGNRAWMATFSEGTEALTLSGARELEAAEGIRGLLAEARHRRASTQEYAYAEGNRLARIKTDEGLVELSYDARGFLTSKRILERDGRSRRWSYGWNARGQLKEVTRPDGAVWSYRYDGLGRRVAKQGPDKEVRYVWDGGTILHEVCSTGRRVSWVYEPGSLQPLVRMEDGREDYVIPGPGGAPSEWIAPDGTWSWTGSPRTWGQPGEETPDGTPWTRGKWYDEESGLYYNGFRYYDPQFGRFISPDPIGVYGRLNEYAAGPCPVNWSDPLGLLEMLDYHTGGPAPVYQSGYGTDNVTLSHPTGDQSFYVGPNKGGQTVAFISTGNPTVQPGQSYAFPSGVLHGYTPGATPPSSTANAHQGFHPDFLAVSPTNIQFKGGGIGNGHHAEIHSLHYIWRNPETFAGQNIYLHISRPPCNQEKATHGNGSCWHSLQALVAATQERLNKTKPGTVIHVTYTEATALNKPKDFC